MAFDQKGRLRGDAIRADAVLDHHAAALIFAQMSRVESKPATEDRIKTSQSEACCSYQLSSFMQAD
jgi:hypothetical protein